MCDVTHIIAHEYFMELSYFIDKATLQSRSVQHQITQ